MSFNYGKRAEPVNGSRLSSRTSRAVMPRRTSYRSSKSYGADDWEQWEDDDVVTLIDVDETPSAEHSDKKKLLFSGAFLDVSASSSAANTRSPSPLDSDSVSISSNEDITPIDSAVEPGLLAPPPTPAYIFTNTATKPTSSRISARRSAANRPVSKKPVKARNAKFGIRLITDMPVMRRQIQAKSPARRAPKFVDAAALRALEGSPNPQSVGNWNWLKNNDGSERASPLQAARSPAEQLSPEDRPIVIGITLPSDEVTSRGIDPLTATVNNIDTPSGTKNPFPFTFQQTKDRTIAPPEESRQLQSVWSPDTPETASSFSTIRYPSSVYSQASMAPVMGLGVRDTEVPPVPAVPANYKRMTAAPQRLLKNAQEERDSGTPCTLFEEDGVTPLKSPASKLSALTPQSVRGWWDHHLVTPFLEKTMSFASRRTQLESPMDDRGHHIAGVADNKGAQGSMLTPKMAADRQSWKTAMSGAEARRSLSPMGRGGNQIASPAANLDGGRAILGLSMLEKEQDSFSSPSEVSLPRGVHGKAPDIPSHDFAGMETSDIFVTFETDDKNASPIKPNAADVSANFTSQTGSYQQTAMETHESTSLKTSTTKEVHEYNFTSTSVTVGDHRTRSTESQPKCGPERDAKRDLTPPRPQWHESQAPIIKVPTPRQTPPPREVVREGSERPIVVHIHVNTGEQQQQKILVDRVAVGSTPTIKIPTPRRTPSPRGDVSKAEVVPDSTRGALARDRSASRERLQGLGITNLATTTPPPASSSKKQAGDGDALKYQAVFPPGHHLHSQFSPREAPLATSTVSTKVREAAASTPSPTVSPVSPVVPPFLTTTTRVAAIKEVASGGATSTTTTRAAASNSRAATQETTVTAASTLSGASMLSSQDSHREHAQRSTREAHSAAHETSTSFSTGNTTFSSRNRNANDISSNTSRIAGLQRQASTAAHAHHVSEQQSRFSVSPTSTKSPDAERGSRAPRHVRAASNFVSSVLSRQRSPVDQSRGGDNRGVQPIEIVLEEQRAPETMPASPQRAYLTFGADPGRGSWTRVDSFDAERGYTEPLPPRPAGASLSHDKLSGKEHKIEKKRQRHEKEDRAARRAGGFWRGRGCIPKKGCLGRPGPEGRKKRRIWLLIIALLLLLLIALGVVLGVVLSRHHGSHSDDSGTQGPGQDSPSSTSPSTPSPESSSIWVNLTDYPAMPTGILTFVGPNNTIAKSDCTAPTTLWSCSLPKDAQASVSPFEANQPTMIFQIQWDNSTERDWNIPNGSPPTAVSKRDESKNSTSIDGFKPDPSPPTFQEMWFLGETTDNIQSNQKAGEPTPFFISLLPSLNETVDTPALSRRAASSSAVNISDIIFPPDLEADGTPAPAVMLPTPVQQPVRLFDRGLPTEHYGFYTYFQRTIFLKSVTVVNDSSQGNVPADEDGGCSETEANHLVTWAETRLLVQIWTRKLNSTASLLPGDDDERIDDSTQLIKPGTMPYPVTVTLDTHGGDPDHKVVWEWPMDDRQKLNTSAPELLANKMDVGGTWINHRGSGDAKFGGFDGGTGGCKCEWVNWT